MEIKKIEKWPVFHDLVCSGCGALTREPRDGAADGTVMGSELLAIAGAAHARRHGTSGTISAFLRDGLGARIKPPAASRATNAAGRGLAGRAQRMRDREEMQANPAEAGEASMPFCTQGGRPSGRGLPRLTAPIPACLSAPAAFAHAGAVLCTAMLLMPAPRPRHARLGDPYDL